MKDQRLKIIDIERKIADLKRQLPAHSLPMTMQLEIEDLEEKLEKYKKELEIERERNA
jgi:hypothetical protein